MENKNKCAFPAMHDIRRREDQEFETLGGLSKHEYAAIMIAQGMVSTLTDVSLFDTSIWHGKKELIAIRATQLAAQVLKECPLNS